MRRSASDGDGDNDDSSTSSNGRCALGGNVSLFYLSIDCETERVRVRAGRAAAACTLRRDNQDRLTSHIHSFTTQKHFLSVYFSQRNSKSRVLAVYVCVH